MSNRRNFSMATKIDALKVLQRNNFNYNTTGKELNIPRGSLMAWHDELGTKVFGQTAVEIADATHEYVDKLDHKFIDIAEKVRIKAINKLDAILDQCTKKTDGFLVIRAMEAIDNAITKGTPGNIEPQINIFQKIKAINQNYIKHEPDNSTIVEVLEPKPQRTNNKTTKPKLRRNSKPNKKG